MVPCEIWGQLSSSLTLASSRSPFSLPSKLISLDDMSRSEESYRYWKSVSWGPLAFLGHKWHHKILRALRDTVEFPEKGLLMSWGMGFLSPCNYFSLNWLSASWGFLSRSLNCDKEEAIQYLLFPKPEISLSLSASLKSFHDSLHPWGVGWTHTFFMNGPSSPERIFILSHLKN